MRRSDSSGSQGGATTYSYHVIYEFVVGGRVHTEMNNVDSYGRLQKGDNITVYYLTRFFPPQSAIDRNPRELSGPLREMLEAIPDELQETGVRTDGTVLDVIRRGTELGPVYGVVFRFWDHEEKPWKNIVWLTEQPGLTVGSRAPVVYLRERPKESALALPESSAKSKVETDYSETDYYGRPLPEPKPLTPAVSLSVEEEPIDPEIASMEPVLEPVSGSLESFSLDAGPETAEESIEEASPEPDHLSAAVLPEIPTPDPERQPVAPAAVEVQDSEERELVAAALQSMETVSRPPVSAERTPSPSDALVAEGIALMGEGKIREASECFTKAIAQDQENRAAREGRADAHDQMGRRASAAGDRRRAAAIK